MRVLYDHQVFSLQDSGGASRYFYELARHLSLAPGVSVNFSAGATASTYPFGSIPGVRSVLTWRTGIRAGTARYCLNEIATAPFIGLRRWDVYHPTLYRISPVARASKIVATHHDCVHERFAATADSAAVISMKKRLYKTADVIICVSSSSRDDLVQYYGINASKTRVIYHGVNPVARNPVAAAELKRMVRMPYILFVGRRSGYKNFDRVLQTYYDTHLCGEFAFLLIGGGPLSEAERGQIGRLGLNQRVVPIPVASDEFLGEAYTAARFLAYPSLYEGFGLPPLEAMQAGCPVVACQASAVAEVCQDAPLYFTPDDDNSLTRAMMTAADNSEDRLRAVRRGYEVAERYKWSDTAARTLAVYLERE